MRPIESTPGVGEAGIKKNDGEGEFKYIYIVRTIVTVTMYLQHNNNKKEIKNRKGKSEKKALFLILQN
jgi:hypothetical protein